MLEGILVKGYGGFYYVKVGAERWECSLRGKFRKQKQDFLAGDKILFNPVGDGKGVIEGVGPRRNQLLRPLVANLDQVLVVIALANPDPDLLLLDRILLMVQREAVLPVICLNKADQVEETKIQSIVKIYQDAGYRVVVASTKTGRGIDEIRELLRDRISVFAGPSGVGKSSLLNALQPGLALKTGHVSEKIGRGRHTTRHVELMETAMGGLIADTPGFSQLDLPDMQRSELQEHYPEIWQRAPECRFSSCLHNSEPDCAVKKALAAGEINQGRYQRYLMLLEQVIAKERRY